MRVCFLSVLLLSAAGMAEPAVPSSMPDPVRNRYNVRSFGAAGDGKQLDTSAIQSAIDAAAGAGGGTVCFPAGTYLSQTLVLKSRITLHLEAGAVLRRSPDPAEDAPSRSLIFAEKAERVAITGRGCIDGQGTAAQKARPNVSANRQSARAARRPHTLLHFVRCTHVRIEGVTLRNSPTWMQHYFECENVTLEGVTVHNHGSRYNDGLDIDSCRNVHVSNCTITSGDDAIVLKSRSPRICEKVTITNCVVSSHSNALKLGTESQGGFRDVTIANCVVTPVDERKHFGNGARQGLAGIALETVDGGILERVAISNITISGTIAPIFIRLGNRARRWHPDPEKTPPAVGRLRGVTISNVVATGASSVGCAIAGLPGHAVEDLTLSNISIAFGATAELANYDDITPGGSLDDVHREVPEKPDAYPECIMFGKLPAYGFYIRHAEGVTLRNIRLSWTAPDQRPALYCDDVRNLHVEGLRAKSAKEAAPLILLKDTREALVRGCIAMPDTRVFLGLEGDTSSVALVGNHLDRAAEVANLAPGVPTGALFQAANRRAP